jgi:hypothetical protein
VLPFPQLGVGRPGLDRPHRRLEVVDEDAVGCFIADRSDGPRECLAHQIKPAPSGAKTPRASRRECARRWLFQIQRFRFPSRNNCSTVLSTSDTKAFSRQAMDLEDLAHQLTAGRYLLRGKMTIRSCW